MTQLAAANFYGIARRTLHNHIKSGSSEKVFGRRCLLNKKEEENFVKDLMGFKDSGIPLTTVFIRRQAFLFSKKHKIKLRPENQRTGLIGPEWLRGFLRRHPDIEIEKGRAAQDC